jgi:hypothetical protein
MRRLAAAGLLCLTLTACTSDATTRVELAIAAGTCEAADLSAVSVISVELLGINDQGRPCALGKRCLFGADAPDSVDDVIRLLQEARQPLLDVSDPDAHTVALIGHATSCWSTSDHVMCGYADLAELTDGVLPMELQCGGCPDDEIVFCP